jgi:hypothetical protein
MKQQTWLDKQLENSRIAVSEWSEQKREALKAQISRLAGVYRLNEPEIRENSDLSQKTA